MVLGACTFLKLSTIPRISHHPVIEGYIQLLKDNLLPFLSLPANNAPIHTAKATSSFLVSNGVKLIKWPQQSPDLNPIEHLQVKLDRVTQKKIASTNCGSS